MFSQTLSQPPSHANAVPPVRDVEVAREVVNWNPDVIVAVTNHIAQAVHAANEATPIVLFGGSLIANGIAGSLAHPGGKIQRAGESARSPGRRDPPPTYQADPSDG